MKKHFIEVEDSNGTRNAELGARALTNGNIFIEEPITGEVANAFIRELKWVANNHNGDINIMLDTPGGECTAGLIMYDAIQAYADRIHIYVTGMAYSMGAVILAGGKKGHRHLLPHSKVLIHEPLIAGGISGNATNIQRTADSIVRMRKELADIFVTHCGQSEKEILSALSFDNEMNAEEAITFGLADDIVTFDTVTMY